MATCARHCGDIGQHEPYRPCGKPASFEVNRPMFGGGAPWWMACREHAEEARANGCRVSGLDDVANDDDEEDARIDRDAQFYERRRLIVARMYERCRVAMALAYRYKAEGVGALGTTTKCVDDRIRDCVMQVRALRDSIRVQRQMRPEEADTAILVGCANDL